jgi:prephenate dehydrogenase
MLKLEKLAVIGLGLIGGSFARALRESMPDLHIRGMDADVAQSARAVDIGVIDEAADSIPAVVQGADLVIVAVPVSAIATCVAAAASAAPGVAITDVGSVKQPLLDALTAEGGIPEHYVPGHPIAGGERFGVDAANASLFRGRRVILTPTAGTAAAALATVRGAWQSVGAVVQSMDARHHDEVLAATSHLPHLLAYALVDCLAGMESRRELFQYAAGGFRDFTRIASSSPAMWRDIIHANRGAVLAALDEFESVLGTLRAAIESDDQGALLATFTRARAARERFLELVEKPAANS